MKQILGIDNCQGMVMRYYLCPLTKWEHWYLYFAWARDNISVWPENQRSKTFNFYTTSSINWDMERATTIFHKRLAAILNEKRDRTSKLEWFNFQSLQDFLHPVILDCKFSWLKWNVYFANVSVTIEVSMARVIYSHELSGLAIQLPSSNNKSFNG